MGVCSLQAGPSIKAFKQGTPSHEATGSLHRFLEGDEGDRQPVDVQLGPGLDLLLEKDTKAIFGFAVGFKTTPQLEEMAKNEKNWGILKIGNVTKETSIKG